MDFPKFKYIENPIGMSIFEKEDFCCSVCSKNRTWIYSGSFFGPSETDDYKICPWCISDGSAAKLGISFNDASEIGITEECDVDDDSKTTELEQRTPGFISWQSSVWLRHCADYCSLIAYVGWDEIKEIEDELAGDIEALSEYAEISEEEFKESLYNEGDHQGYLFRCIHCGKNRLYSDTL